MTHRLLVIEHPGVSRDASVCAMLTPDAGFSCDAVDWDSLRFDCLRVAAAHVIVAVPERPTPRVMSVFEWLRRSAIATPTFAVLPSGVEAALLRMASEASDDFILAPVRRDELHHRLGRVLGTRHDVEAVRSRLLEEADLAQLVGEDPIFLRTIAEVPRIARSDVTVLITGETGTGKELCARAIHHLGPRREFPFIAVDCGAVPDHLFENEMFGHARGAFTDAHRDQRGLVSLAEKGTLFLDEIDALSPAAQAKLLRFLQEHAFRPLGSDRFFTANVNVIAATNRDLEACVRAKTFRADLYFRLNVLRLHLPALRERATDIGLLAGHFLDERRRASEPIRKTFSAAAVRKLAAYSWPGNVRELFNVVQRAAVACEGTRILASHVSLPGVPGLDREAGDFRSARAAAVETFERLYVEELLARHGGNVTRAAHAAQKDRRAFGRLMKKYRIDRAAF